MNADYNDELDPEGPSPEELDGSDDDDETATLACPACGADVYEDAVVCPACGANITPAARCGRGAWAIAVLVLLVAAGLVWTALGSSAG
ncbi:MAG: hypothetical protein CHACPFDD_03742 [Phycisphaerae bacterium]|nr:hypothetical protein [Phycisphaerae bacterium]